jgi:hypothetical protein
VEGECAGCAAACGAAASSAHGFNLRTPVVRHSAAVWMGQSDEEKKKWRRTNKKKEKARPSVRVVGGCLGACHAHRIHSYSYWSFIPPPSASRAGAGCTCSETLNVFLWPLALLSFLLSDQPPIGPPGQPPPLHSPNRTPAAQPVCAFHHSACNSITTAAARDR